MKLKKKPNYELKAKVLENGCCKALKKYNLSHWKYCQLINESISNGVVIEETKLNQAEEYINKTKQSLDLFTEEEIKEAIRVNEASYKRTTRLKNRILDILTNSNAIFLTLTFKPSVLASTTEETRRQYIYRFLKKQCSRYVANIDFGEKRGREHYHAVVLPKEEKIDNKEYNEKYGSIDFERCWIKANEEDFENTSKRLAKYVNKLTNHAIKETTKQSRVIYSRN